MVFGGTILLTSVLSYFIFKETLRGFELAGLTFVLIGISFIIYCPRGSMMNHKEVEEYVLGMPNSKPGLSLWW